MTELSCLKCGGKLERKGEEYECLYCKSVFEAENFDRVTSTLAAMFDEQKQEKLAALRQMLWEAIHEEYTDSEKIVGICSDIRKLLPNDFSARFFEVANGGSEAQINAFLRSADLKDDGVKIWAEETVKFMLKSLRAKNLLSVQNFIDRAFKSVDLEKYEKYSTVFSKEAQRVKGGLYEPSEPRDVFVMYSSKDMQAVEELVEYLEERGISCFVAMRNLQHGRGAVANYQAALNKAMSACRTVVFLSSKHSRSMECDAVRIEIPYFMEQDKLNAPHEFRQHYEKMPEIYKKPRVEYRLDDEKGASGLIKEFFASLEYVYSKEEAAKRIETYLTAAVKTGEKKDAADEKICLACGAKNPEKAKLCMECGGKEFVKTQKEYAEKLLEKERNKAAEEKQKLLAEIEALKKAKKTGKKQDEAPVSEANGENIPKESETDKKIREAKEKFLKREQEKFDNILWTGKKKEMLKGYHPNGDCIYFGVYPQSKKDKKVIVYDEVGEHGWHKGSDGAYYEKGADGMHYKVEPIKWRILYENGDTLKLIADKILDYSGSRIDYEKMDSHGAYYGKYHYFIKKSVGMINKATFQIKDEDISWLSKDEAAERFSKKELKREWTDYARTQIQRSGYVKKTKFAGWHLSEERYVSTAGKIEYSEKSGDRGFVPCIKLKISAKRPEMSDIEKGYEYVCMAGGYYSFKKLEVVKGQEVKINEYLYERSYYRIYEGDIRSDFVGSPCNGIVVWTSEKGEEIETPNGTKVCHVKILPTDGL